MDFKRLLLQQSVKANPMRLSAEEKAMKPSPENTSPISRLNFRRQLDLGGDLASHLRIADCEKKTVNLNNDRLTTSKVSRANELNLDPIKLLNQNNKTQELITGAPDNFAQIASPAKTTQNDQNISSLTSRNDV